MQYWGEELNRGTQNFQDYEEDAAQQRFLGLKNVIEETC